MSDHEPGLSNPFKDAFERDMREIGHLKDWNKRVPDLNADETWKVNGTGAQQSMGLEDLEADAAFKVRQIQEEFDVDELTAELLAIQAAYCERVKALMLGKEPA